MAVSVIVIVPMLVPMAAGMFVRIPMVVFMGTAFVVMRVIVHRVNATRASNARHK